MGRKRDQLGPHNGDKARPLNVNGGGPQYPQDMPGVTRPLVGVRLMQEPGFAAQDCHLYRRQQINLSATSFQLNAKPNYLRDNPQNSGSQLQEYQCYDRLSNKDKPSHRKRHRAKIPPTYDPHADNMNLGTDFRGAINRLPCPVPQSLIKSLYSKEQSSSIGKVHVSLRVTPSIPLSKDESSVLSVDKKRRQVTIMETRNAMTEERVGVSAPKMFVFDQVYSQDEPQSSISTKVLPDIIDTVLGGTDGCIMSFGSNGMGKTRTMIGSHLTGGELGIVPTAISWLYQCIAHLKANKAARFSVRVSAAVVDACGKQVSDVLGYFAQENETSPGALLRQGSNGLLSSVVELRAPFPETAARYLDLALSARKTLDMESSKIGMGPSTLLYTLHIYQYTFDKTNKGKVTGGRSRLHFLDFGDLSGGSRGESLSLSGLTSVLLAIFSGHKYLPHKHNKLTQLLQEILGSVTCHTGMVVHISPSVRHIQHTLATLQLAARVHRLRRKKIKGFGRSGSGGSSEGSCSRSSGGSTSAGSSSLDFSSSEQSADTVIYIGGSGPGDSSDGEHPPVFFPHHIRRHRSVELPRLNSFEHLRSHTASPNPVLQRRPISASPTPTSRSVPSGIPRGRPKPPPRHSSARNLSNVANNNYNNAPISSPIQTNFFRHQPGVSQVVYYKNESHNLSFSPVANQTILTNKTPDRPQVLKQLNSNCYQEPNTLVPVFSNSQIRSSASESDSNQTRIYSFKKEQRKHCPPKSPSKLPIKQCSKENGHLKSKSNGMTDVPASDEQWIDGPRISKTRVVNGKEKLPQTETWIDGPTTEKVDGVISYGYMDDHKKTMIERWVENQTAQVGTKTKGEISETRSNTLLNSTDLTSFIQHNSSVVEDVNPESDLDTISEDQSGFLNSSENKQPDLIEELEKKNLIPVCSLDKTRGKNPGAFLGEGTLLKNKLSKLTDHMNGDTSAEDICSQCEAIAEECDELNSLLSCEEEECKKQTHNGLATVVEEPELESACGADDPVLEDSVSLLNNPQTDCEDGDIGTLSEAEKTDSLKYNGDDLFRNQKGSPPVRHSCRKMTECGVQVCEEDIQMTLSITPCPSDATAASLSDDHPLRALSEENLTCASTFTDSCSHIGETIEEECEEEDSRPFSLFEATSKYGNIYPDFSRALQSGDIRKDMRELDNIHSFFSAFTRPPGSRQTDDILNSSLFKSLIESRNTQRAGSQPQFPQRNPVSNNIDCHFQLKSSCDACSVNNNVDNGNNNPVDDTYNQPSTDSHFPIRCSMDKSTGTDEGYLRNTSNVCNDVCCNSGSICNIPNLNTVSSLENQAQIPILHNLKIIESNINNINCYRSNENSIDSLPEVHSDSLSNKSDDDSDNLSCASEDSEYMVQNSKFSKFLCVGIGRSKSKPYTKSNKINNNKQLENKRSGFRVRDHKLKNNKEKDIIKISEHDSKNVDKSPSQIQRDLDTRLSGKAELLTTAQLIPRISEANYHCNCDTTVKPSSINNIESTLEIPLRTCSVSTSIQNKSWEMSPTPITSPQMCSTDLPQENVCNRTASNTLATSGSLGTTQSLGESSGYESIPRDSECSSFSSSQESEVDDEHRRFLSAVRNQRPTVASITSPNSLSSESDSKGVESKIPNSFFRHLTKRSSSKGDAKLVSSTTWKYRC